MSNTTTIIHESLQYISAAPLAIKMDFIPQEMQLPLVVAVSLLGFLLVLGLSRVSSKKVEEKNVQFDAPSTPAKSSTPGKSGTPIDKKTGSVMTPGGRRSARLAKSRKED